MKNICIRILTMVFGLTLVLTVFLGAAVPTADTPSSWAVEQVNAAIEENLVPHNLQSDYKQAITRAEFSALAVSLYESLQGAITGRTTFVDTNDVNVEMAAYIGIVSGVGENRFDPNGILTREQAAVMLSRLSDAIGKPFPSPCQTHIFADSSDISLWAIDSVAKVYKAGIMTGIGANQFAPLQSFTREQGIVTIMRIFNSANSRDGNYYCSDECQLIVDDRVVFFGECGIVTDNLAVISDECKITVIDRIELSDGRQLTVVDRSIFWNESRLTVTDRVVLSDDYQLFAVEPRIDFFINATRFVCNIIVGTPIKKIQGATEAMSCSSVVVVTDYYFKVLNWAFGVPGEEIITVRSQVGNVFEIGGEYTFAAGRTNSVFFDLYSVVSNTWIIKNEEILETDLRYLLDIVGRMPVTRIPPEVIEEAVPTMDFVKKNVDVAVIATITNIRERIDDFGIFDARLDLVEVVHGEVRSDAFNQSTMLRGDVTVGSTYLILFSANERGHLRLLARHGAIIPYGSPEFYSFMELFELIN